MRKLRLRLSYLPKFLPAHTPQSPPEFEHKLGLDKKCSRVPFGQERSQTDLGTPGTFQCLSPLICKLGIPSFICVQVSIQCQAYSERTHADPALQQWQTLNTRKPARKIITRQNEKQGAQRLTQEGRAKTCPGGHIRWARVRGVTFQNNGQKDVLGADVNHSICQTCS